MTTDFRDVFAEALYAHMGLSLARWARSSRASRAKQRTSRACTPEFTTEVQPEPQSPL